VIEGVETDEQLAWLSSLGGIEAQGFLFSRPVPSDALPALFKRFGLHALSALGAPEAIDG
jgi:EAL domain-containing protein (putative c-di-GMP-specific phosphodiesterase class I)